MIKTTMLLAAIAAVTATSCNPFGQYKCRARQSEAKATLGAIQAGENAYFAEHKSYTAATSDLGVAISPHFYSIELSIVGAGKGYKATAKGDKPDTTGDEWTVDESGPVKAVTDKCAH
jgi:type IV pilus assembly protein PilA